MSKHLDSIPTEHLVGALQERGRIVIPDNWHVHHQVMDLGHGLNNRNMGGWYYHPNFPWALLNYPTDMEILLNGLKLEAATVYLMQHAPVDVRKVWLTKDEDAGCEYWTPPRPEGDGWFLLCIADSDDGPLATWVRRVVERPAAEGG